MRVFILIAVVFAALSAPASAAEDIGAIEGVIRSQEQALSRDDAAAAYSYAAPAIQRMYPDPAAFMLMVRTGFAPVYRHRYFEFGKASTADGTITQEVQIVDFEGNAWIALYTLERQADGSLKISGCSLVKLASA